MTGARALEGLDGLDRLVALAEPLAAAWAARGRASTTLGVERAILRLFGVAGLARDGRPLAAAVVDAHAGRRPDRLAVGLGLPFAMAMAEYDRSPQDLAEHVAAGHLDLSLDVELLGVAVRRTEAAGIVRDLVAAALERIDANRTAREELVRLLGEPGRPWIGVAAGSATAGEAAGEARDAAAAGADLVRVAVPAGRELVDRMQDAGLEPPVWRPGEGADAALGGSPAGPLSPDAAHAPAGSQRGLATIRAALDEAAANRRGYVRLATRAPALAAPEQAVVAAFERVDVVEADPMAEIVLGGVDPDRAIADHAFAHRLSLRAGTTVLVGSGPLVVAPDLERGQSTDTATLAGRALALQLLGVLLARASGLPPSRLLVGGLPGFIVTEPDAAARTVAEIVLRRALYPGHELVLDETEPSGEAAADRWPYLAALAMSVHAGGQAPADETALVVRRAATTDVSSLVADTRAAVGVARSAGDAFSRGALAGPARAHAQGAIRAAIETLEALADEGWRAVLGEPIGGQDRERLGADAVVERGEPFDPFEAPAG